MADSNKPSLNSRPEMRDLVEWLHDLIKWEEFGTFLPGIKNNHIEMIKANHLNAEVNDKKRALYDQWLRIDPNASWSNVIEALKTMKENTLAAKINKLIGGTSTGVSVSSSATSAPHHGGGANTSTSTAAAVQLNDKSIKILQNIIKNGLRSKYDKTERALSSSIERVASKLYAKELIGEAVKDKPDFSKIASGFNSILEFKSTKDEIEDLCQMFLESISSEGGPAKECAKDLKREWKQKAKENLSIELNI